ncbi:hypothetical protein DYB32_001660 [Aphanomyces invadans]|nr:hypothetical protein DYB32_001660 [Aphanomyces invadans]
MATTVAPDSSSSDSFNVTTIVLVTVLAGALVVAAILVYRRRLRAAQAERTTKISYPLSPGHIFSSSTPYSEVFIRPSEIMSPWSDGYESARFQEMVRTRVNLS